MPKTSKPTIEIIVDEKAPIVIESQAVKAAKFKDMIEAYKVQNPAKYALKKDALEKKLKSLSS